jgi:tetratricopeptide (TPR) repeat protein
MAGGGEPGGGWDFFVSYTQADRRWAEWIAWVLEEHGHYRVLVQAWDFVPGSNWVQKMQDGTRDATRTLAVLSDAYLASQYGSAEWQAAWAADPGGADRKLLVVRVANCDRPGLLAGVVGADLFGIDGPAARARLLDMVATAIAGRAKPATAPEFPGTGRAVPEEPHFPGALPRIRKIPAANPHFTGRGPELDRLARDLAAGSRVMVHSVRGMGGVGKTQLATEYAHAHLRDYDLVWWIAAEEPAAIPDQFTALATRLGLEPATEPDTLATQVHDRLAAVAGWLLIFDNADSVAAIQPWLPPGPQPAGIPGHVIVTTRRGGFGSLGQVMDLDVIDLADAVDLLRTRVDDLGQDVGEQIADELGRLPLALEQAAAYLDRVELPPGDYLDLLRARAADLYARGQAVSRSDTIVTLWDLSLERLTAEDPTAVQLLDICAYLAPVPVPLDLFSAHPGQLPEPLSTSAADPLAFAETVGVLADYSLAKRTGAGLQLHRLVQATIRARHGQAPPAPSSHALEQDGPQPGGTAGYEPEAHPLALALGLLQADVPDEISAPQNWPQWAVLLPHVLAATSHLDSAAGQPNSQAMTVGSALLGQAGFYLWTQARHTDAKALEERALAIDEATYGPDHPNVATRLNNLALTVRDLGQPEAARALQERALAIDEATYGPDHPNVATRLNNLAVTLRDLGQLEAARPLQERALAIDEATYGPDHPDVATDLGNLALILQDLGQLEAARPLQERALAIDEATYGPDHPDVARDLNNVALILQDLGQPEAARPLQERALAIDEATYGPDHPNVARDLNNVALILQDLGQPEAARPLQERALAIDEASYGPDHPDVARDLNNVAQILQDLGQPEAARPLQERALAIDEATYGPDHPNVARDLNNLAQILQDLGQPEAAQPLQERALAITEATRSARTAPPGEGEDT